MNKLIKIGSFFAGYVIISIVLFTLFSPRGLDVTAPIGLPIGLLYALGYLPHYYGLLGLVFIVIILCGLWLLEVFRFRFQNKKYILYYYGILIPFFAVAYYFFILLVLRLLYPGGL